MQGAPTGAFKVLACSGGGGLYGAGNIIDYDVAMDVSRVVPTSDENRPVNVSLPVCLYLGIST